MLVNKSQNNLLIYGIIIFGLLSAMAITADIYYFTVILGVIFIVLFFVKFEIAFPLLLIARSSLDIFTDVGFDIGPLNFNIPAGLSLFIDVVGLIYLGLIYFYKKKQIMDRLSKSFLIWLLALLFGVFWAYHNFGKEGLMSIREWTRLFSLLVVYLLSVHIARLKGYEYLVNCTLLSLIIPVAVGYYQIFIDPPTMMSKISRIYGTLAHPNALSLYLVLFMAITTWKMKFSRLKLPWIILLAILIFALINAFSIGGLLMFLIFASYIAYQELDLKYKVLFVLFSIICLFVFANSEMGQQRIEELKTTPSITVVAKDEVVTNSITWRIVNWKFLYEKWEKQPLLGYGLGMSGAANYLYQFAPHNDYLRFLVEFGLFGFIITMWFFTQIWLYLNSANKTLKDARQQYLAMVMKVVFITWMIGATVDNYIGTTTFQFYFWAILACVMTEPTENPDIEKSTNNHILPH